MMQMLGLAAAECENYRTCDKAVDYPPGMSDDLLRAGPDGGYGP
jgi:hypothetical protein